MTLQGYIDEIIIQDIRVNEATIELYKLLGLDVTYEKKVLKLISTRIAVIESFAEDIKLKIGRSHCNNLVKNNVLTEKAAYSHVLYDNLGTKIIIRVSRSHNNIRIGVLTSGGDAPGMNSAVRSIIRTSLKNDIKIFGIYGGFEGLIRGDIRKLGWKSETESSGKGGTYLLSTRSERFKSKEGRKEAAYNLLTRKITSLIVIGGDGSMTGAMKLKDEYEEHCKELSKEGRVTIKAIENDKKKKERRKRKALKDRRMKLSKKRHIGFEETDSSEEFNTGIDDVGFIENVVADRFTLDLVVIPATIDNDIIGVDYSLGSNTALTRIMEVVDKLDSTMKSHKRIFILECMGRDCGWLTLMAGFAVNSDSIIISENANFGWQEEMLNVIKTAYATNDSKKLVFLSEGARDYNGNQILAQDVKKIFSDSKMSARLLKIGHIQRGGVTCAFDRTLGTLSGIKAVNCIVDRIATPKLVGMIDGEICVLDLQVVVDKTQEARKKLQDCKYDDVLELRDKHFRAIYKLHFNHQLKLKTKFNKQTFDTSSVKTSTVHEFIENRMEKATEPHESLVQVNKEKKLKIGVLTDGMCSSGMNTVLNSIIQIGVCNDCEVVYFFDGYDGVVDSNMRRAYIFEFSSKHNEGGSIIGTSHKPISIHMIKKKLAELEIDYLVVIGSTTSIKFAKEIKNLILIPACIENNCPGSQVSIGSDTALNMILMGSEISRLAAQNTRERIFMIEISGGNCGYLTIMGGISCGAFEIIYPEECHLNDLITIKKRIKDVFVRQKNNTIIIFRNSNTFNQLPTESICKILCSNTKMKFNYSLLGNIERGITPTAIDKINARLCAFKAIEACFEGRSSGVVGVVQSACVFTGIEQILEDYDEETDSIKDPNWLKYSKVCSSLE